MIVQLETATHPVLADIIRWRLYHERGMNPPLEPTVMAIVSAIYDLQEGQFTCHNTCYTCIEAKKLLMRYDLMDLVDY